MAGKKRKKLEGRGSHKATKFEKELMSQLLRERKYIFMDNVCGKVRSSFLDMALTGGYQNVRAPAHRSGKSFLVHELLSQLGRKA